MTKEDINIFKNIPTVTTERLVLRKIRMQDINDVYDYGSDPEVSKFLLWYPHPDHAYTRTYLRQLMHRYKRGEFYDWGVVINNKMIGTCGFTSFDLANNSAEIGYVLNRRFWNKGIGYEAASMVVRFGFEVLKLNRIEVRYIAENRASEALAIKLGFKTEGILRSAIQCKGRYCDLGVASITRKEYLSL